MGLEQINKPPKSGAMSFADHGHVRFFLFRRKAEKFSQCGGKIKIVSGAVRARYLFGKGDGFEEIAEDLLVYVLESAAR